MSKNLNKFYIYIHCRASDGLPFYVGKGSGKRAWQFSGRNSHWKNTRNKHGVFVEIVFDNLTEEESFQCEKDTILEFNYFNYPLTNKTTGGEGISGYIHSEKSRRSMADDAVYTFVHKDGTIFIGTRYDLTNVKSVDRLNLSQMFSNYKLDSASGWGVKKSGETIEDCIKRITTKRSIAKSDKNEYCFIHKTGLLFKGTRYALCEAYDVNLNRLCELFSNKRRKSVLGWSLVKETT